MRPPEAGDVHQHHRYPDVQWDIPSGHQAIKMFTRAVSSLCGHHSRQDVHRATMRGSHIVPTELKYVEAKKSVPGQPPEGVEQGAQLSDFVKFPDTWPFFL